MKYRLPLLALAAAALSLNSCLPPVDDLEELLEGPPLDCSTRLKSHDDPDWACVKASSFGGGCVPAEAFREWRCLELDADAKLCEDGEPFRMSVYLTTDAVSLDCRGQAIDHGYSSKLSPKRPGVRTPYSRSVSDVKLANCVIRDVGAYGVDLKRYFRGEQLKGGMKGHRGISVRNFQIADTGQIGVYVGQNSEDTVIEDTTIDRAHLGIYLEAGSRRARVTRAAIRDSRVREGIAIDSSSDNLVENSLFQGNGPGHAINLYKNCGEKYGQVCPLERKTDAADNILRDNFFAGDEVNVAWRQHQLKVGDRCVTIGGAGFWRDRVPGTLLHDNVFDLGSKLVIQEGPVLVHGNEFRGGGLEIGKANVEISGEIFDNRFDKATPIHYSSSMDALRGLEIHGNTIQRKR